MAEGAKKVGGAAAGKSSAEGEEGKKGKRAKKVKRVAFPGKKPADGFKEAMPKDFDFKLHKPLKKADFGSTALFMQHKASFIDYRADGMKELANKMRAKAERFAALGDDKTAKKVKKAERIQKQLAELSKELEGSGIDINKILEEAKKEAVAAE